MIYDIVGKRNLEEQVSGEKIIITEHAGDGKFKDVTFLQKAWEQAQLKSKPTEKDDPKAEGYGLELEFLRKGVIDSGVQPHVALRILPI
jgi:hypothetical protein